MGEVISIDDKMPAVVVNTRNGKVHVIPFCVIYDIIEGKMEFEDLDDWRIIMRTILADFMKG